MNYKLNSFPKKPEQNIPNKQLFSFDINYEGAKNFIFKTYDDIYDIIINEKNPNFYEDHTFNNKIKLHLDIDKKIQFNNQLERDSHVNNFIKLIIDPINKKLELRTKIIILISDTLNKLSIHIIYPMIMFSNIITMKYFITDIKELLEMDELDKSIYRIGSFRMLHCEKKGKNNKLIYYDGINYNYEDDNELFLDCCICNVDKSDPIYNYEVKNNLPKSILYKNQERNFIYNNVDYDKIKAALVVLSDHCNDYSKWLTITFALKDLYLSVKDDEKDLVYDLFDNFSKKSNKYNEQENKKIFFNLEPKIDINYLFNLVDISYVLYPFYNYQKIIFDRNNHKNIVIKKEKYINIKINELLKFKYIFLKSPTGTGKTTFLKKIIEKIGIVNILSITSRVNLAGEHMKHLGLEFYKDVKDFRSCKNLVIQMESLERCNYKLFNNGIVILDEINSLLSHLRSPTMNNRRKHVYMYLMEIIKNAKYVIGLDADLSDWNIKFLNEIDNQEYIVYYNTIQNKLNNKAIFYNDYNVMLDIMTENIRNNKYFISCFDSLRQMNQIIGYLSKFGKKEEWLIYSSEVSYNLIDTKDWQNKFVFYTPSIIYGIDYNYSSIEVFCFINKNHLNPLQIYQMISRARKQELVHIYINEKLTYSKYKSVDDVIRETENYEKNFSYLQPNYKDYIDIDDKAYRIMYYNYKYMDNILKTNTKGYLIDILHNNNGYKIEYNNENVEMKLNKKENKKIIIKERIIEMLNLDKDNLNEYETKLVSDDKALDKYLNLCIYKKSDIDSKIIESIGNNLYIETFKNKFTKIKIANELLYVLDIFKIEKLSKDVTKHFKDDKVDNTWLSENIDTIKKTFEIRTNKYDDLSYYNIYLLLITILKSLFDDNIFIQKRIQTNNNKYNYYEINKELLEQHINSIKNIDN
jgi:hypothetical protein